MSSGGVDPEIVPIERYAEVLAHLAHFEGAPVAEVLARLGVEDGAWASAKLAWTAAIRAELGRREVALSQAFGASFEATRRRLDEERPPLSSIGCAEEEPPIEAAPPIEPPPPPAAPEPPAEIAASAPEPPAEDLAGTQSLNLGALLKGARDALPFQGNAPAAVALERAKQHAEQIQGSAAPRPPADADVGGTMDVSSFVALAKATPFDPKADAPPPASAPREPAPRPPADADVGGTMDVSRFVAAAKATPFAPATGPSPLASAPREPAPRPPADADVGGTMDVSRFVAAAKATPFERAAPPAPEAPPSRPSPPAALEPSLTLEQYAALCVELAMYPAHGWEVLKRYGLGAEQKVKLDQHWQRVFAARPDQRAAWEQACATYRTWILQRGSK